MTLQTGVFVKVIGYQSFEEFKTWNGACRDNFVLVAGDMRTVKQIRRFYGKIPGQSISRYLYGRLLVEHF